jgi:hypothetical protein
MVAVQPDASRGLIGFDGDKRSYKPAIPVTGSPVKTMRSRVPSRF